MNRCWLPLVASLILPLCLVGCGSSSTDVDDEFGSELADFDIVEGTDDSGSVQDAPNAPPPSGRVRLQLKVGDRFPLIKSVQQSLVTDGDSSASPSQSLLELMLALQVEQVLDDRILMSVRYHRVRYQHDIAGEHIEFDSQQPSQSIPNEVQPYRGLMNNGFSFWLGMNNEIIEVVDFEGFAERCARNVAPQFRQPLLAELRESVGSNGSDGIVNFLDDSIGLLPFGDETNSGVVEVGSKWQRSRTISRPHPVTMNLTCTLTSINDALAEVDIIEQIGGTKVDLPQASPDNRVEIRGGHAIGRCTIDRKSGMPIHSQFERFMDLMVHTADGQQVGQKKYVMTTIRTFPEQAPPTQPVALESAGPGDLPANDETTPTRTVQQVGGVQQAGGVQHAGGVVPTGGAVTPAFNESPAASYGDAPKAQY